MQYAKNLKLVNIIFFFLNKERYNNMYYACFKEGSHCLYKIKNKESVNTLKTNKNLFYWVVYNKKKVVFRI